jgi:hypothetical protein
MPLGSKRQINKIIKSFLIFKINEIKAAPFEPRIFKSKGYGFFYLIIFLIIFQHELTLPLELFRDTQYRRGIKY